jgi:hypothetical protein
MSDSVPGRLAMALDHGVSEGPGHARERRPPHHVLEVRERGLRAQRWARQRIAAHEELVDRIEVSVCQVAGGHHRSRFAVESGLSRL